MRDQHTRTLKKPLTFGGEPTSYPPTVFSTLCVSALAITCVASAQPVYRRSIADRSPLAG